MPLRPVLACLLLALPACAPSGLADDRALSRSMRSLEKAIDGLERERRGGGAAGFVGSAERVRAEPSSEAAQSALDRAVPTLRAALHRTQEATAGLPGRALDDVRRDVDALTESAEQMERAAAAGEADRMPGLTRRIAGQAALTTRDLRAELGALRPELSAAPPAASCADGARCPEGAPRGRLVGRVPTIREILTVRAAAALYAAASLLGLLAALRAQAARAQYERRWHAPLYASMVALGLAAMTLGARPIAAAVSPPISIPSGDEACRAAAVKGAALEAALVPPPAHGARPLQGDPSALAASNKALAAEVHELAAECVTFAAAPEATGPAARYLSLADAYLEIKDRIAERPPAEAATPGRRRQARPARDEPANPGAASFGRGRLGAAAAPF